MTRFGLRLSRLAAAIGLAVVPMACSVSEDEEQQLGDSYAREIEAQVPLVADPAATQYLRELGEELARVADDRERRWRFNIVDAPEVNAFAIPGGHIYVNRGLIERTTSMPELAGVLGHEIGHVVRRHSAEQLEKRRGLGAGLAVVCALTSICSGEVARVAINVGGAAYFARHSQQDELEADAEGVRYLLAARIDPRGIPSLFEKLMEERRRQPGGLEAWFSTHPLEETRVERARVIIAELDSTSGGRLERDDPEFNRFREYLRTLPRSSSPRASQQTP
jgi:predicted Zn-dependent protease